ncbi:MAG: hypothetical protein NZ533_11540 [Casimicrobiaceae bacterium]|nr:hypothetical protein [Casimicrobiaceae bacterium]
MAKAIEECGKNKSDTGFKCMRSGLGLYGESPGSVKQVVHDGDTIQVRALGNFSIRFLGVDTPEISFTLPGKETFTSIGDPGWQTFLDDPFKGAPVWDLPYNTELRSYLTGKIGQGCAANHHRHAQAAQRALEGEIESDMKKLGQDRSSFRFFLAFAHDLMDGYGRLLAYVNVEQQEKPYPKPYQERLLEQGLALPYFIWPNIDPFFSLLRKHRSLSDAVPKPGRMREEAFASAKLKAAREAFAKAREEKRGVFEASDPLRLEPFELRFLAKQRLPDRWLIDLSWDSDELLPPRRYHLVRNPEDRLWVPAEYVPLFVERGWRRAC